MTLITVALIIIAMSIFLFRELLLRPESWQLFWLFISAGHK